jgi:hypothetical protein
MQWLRKVLFVLYSGKRRADVNSVRWLHLSQCNTLPIDHGGTAYCVPAIALGLQAVPFACEDPTAEGQWCDKLVQRGASEYQMQMYSANAGSWAKWRRIIREIEQYMC